MLHLSKCWYLFYCFSFNCGENWHDPVKCKWLRKWIKKCDDDSETSNWIAANTKVSYLPSSVKPTYIWNIER